MLKPMLLHYAEGNVPNNRADLLNELKFDGIRLLAFRENQVRLFSKQGLEMTNRFIELQAPKVPPGTVLDAEIVQLGPDGKPDFESLMARFHMGAEKAKKAAQHQSVEAVVFDILQYKGRNVMGLPMLERKRILEDALVEDDYYKRIRFITGQGAAYFSRVDDEQLEGIVQREPSGRYEQGVRSRSVQKVICYRETDVWITGFLTKEFGWLIGEERDGRIVPAGTLQLGVNETIRKSVFPYLQRLIRKRSTNMVSVEPVLRCRVKHRGWYRSGLLRLPVLVGFSPPAV